MVIEDSTGLSKFLCLDARLGIDEWSAGVRTDAESHSWLGRGEPESGGSR